MNMQEKFTAALRELAEEHDLDLVVEHAYANTGFFSFQPRGSFEPVVRFPFGFQTGYSTFASGVGPGPLGMNPKGGLWRFVEGGEHDVVLARVAVILDGVADGGPAGEEG